MKNLERLFAEKLLKIKAIKLQPANPFTWASGWKSPFYCDNRKTLSYPSLRNFVKIEITRLILERFGQSFTVVTVKGGFPSRSPCKRVSGLKFNSFNLQQFLRK